MELIDRSKIPNFKVWGMTVVGDKKQPAKMEFVLWDTIKSMPTIDADDLIKHGEWADRCDYCPVCGEDKFADLNADVWADWQPKYCPNCGAKMDMKS